MKRAREVMAHCTRAREVMAHCTLGAIDKAAQELDQSTTMEDGARMALSLHLNEANIAFWNDRVTTTKSEVIEALRQTAKDLRNSK